MDRAVAEYNDLFVIAYPRDRLWIEFAYLVKRIANYVELALHGGALNEER